MENQVSVGDQNTQQIGQNPVNRSEFITEKPKINYVLIGGIVLVCFVIFGFGGYYLGKQSNSIPSSPSPQPTQQTLLNPSPVNDQITVSQSPSSNITVSWNTYKFVDYPLEFKYPSTIFTLKEKPDPYESNFVIGLYRGDEKIMTIRPEQQGIGFENPDVEITAVPIIVDGKPLVIGGKEIQKTKLYNKVEKTTAYIVIISYPDQRSYSVMIPSFFDDNSQNKQLSETFDRIISTIKFTN